MNISSTCIPASLKQQSPLEGVGNVTHDSIIDALENQTVQILSMNPLKGAMVNIYGGCPPEIKKSEIHNFEDYGDKLNHLAVFDLYDEHLQPTGAVFTNPNVNEFNDIRFGYGGLFFNRSKLEQLPLLVTDDQSLAFKTAYPVYAPYSDRVISIHCLKALIQAHPNVCFIGKRPLNPMPIF